MTFGWMVGEIVRRTAPERRDVRQFVADELSAPLGLTDLLLGIDDLAEAHVAGLTDRNADDPPPPLATLYSQSMPPAVALVPSVFEWADVRRACIPGVGGIFNARDEARFWGDAGRGWIA
ncbi:serine hydrolase [Novosphingobium sp. ERN07]|uniref:serine hydrolase n=1 Tax=Novosphingobium sp. ERN07 TaxID=2726187 RepID=UPI001F0F9811|nr:serine hydrolase [Novosphingobium sp. ERN07]